MTCPNCGTLNREEARFCKRCGLWLKSDCPFCSARLPEAAIYCDQCGRALAGVPAAGTDIGTELSPALAETRPGSRAPDSVPARMENSSAPAPQSLDARLQQYIPKELLTKLNAARVSGEMVGERRVVTMLFCDVKGSTAAAEQLDPEDWSEIINGAFEHMIRPVYRYEGTLARLMGDSILAFFGAPLAHEDDPQRAVLAGLDIVAAMEPYRAQVREKWGIEFDVRVGINTGRVVVGAVGSDLRMEYTALGDAINLAARMEQTAKPGTVQVAHDTYKLIRPLFDFEELGGIEVKGKSEPVLAYRVLRQRSDAGAVRGIEGLRAELVGRDEEMVALRGTVEDLRQGLGRIVCVLGEAGLGKTRLVAETLKVFRNDIGEAGNCFETSSLSYETNHAYGLIQRLIRNVHDIPHTDPPAAVMKKLTPMLAGFPEARRPAVMRILETLFGVEDRNGEAPLEGEAFKRDLRETMEAWWETRFGDRPTVLVFDDMHWGDAASVELLLHLLPLTERLPLALVCALRAERQAPAWRIRVAADEDYRHRYTEVSLRPFTEAESNELLNRLLVHADLPERMRASVLEKSGGNPFFIEEVVRALIESGAVVAEEEAVNGRTHRVWRATGQGADFEIPDTLQSLLATRIDRLEEGTRGTLEMASVIGRSFYHRVLAVVDEAPQELDKHIGTLIRVDMIREAARVPEREYAFRNPLTQEAVYKTILLKRRREFHRRVGEALEALYADRLEGFYGLLVHHFALAVRRDKAIHYSRLASRQAVDLFAYDEAAQNLRAALELVEPGEVSETHRDLRESLADVYRLLRDGGNAIVEYRRALELLRALPDADRLTAVRLHRKIVQVVTDLKWSVSLEDLQRANDSRLESRAALEAELTLLKSAPPNAETARALVALSIDAWRIQDPPDWEAAHRFAEDAVAMAERLDSPDDLSRALGALASVLDGRSLLREHLHVAARRLEVSRDPRVDDPRETIDALRGMGAALAFVGEYKAALPHLREAEALAAKAQVIEQQANAIGLQSQCWLRLDRWDEVLETEVRWRDLERRFSRERVGETCFFVALSARVHALRGDRARADLYARESFEWMLAMSGSPEGWQRNQFY